MILLGFLIISLQINLIENASRRSAILDCSRRNSDGLYGRGCSSKFLRCYDGKLYIYRCRSNLKFNVETAKCEERRQVIACINNMDNDQIIVKADDSFDCSKRKDGVYGSGKCSTTYYHCFRGHSSEMLCPAGLYYNDKLKGCDEVDSIDECNVLTALQGFNERRESHLGERGKYIERNLLSTFDTNGDTHRLSLGKEKNANSHGSNDKKRSARRTLCPDGQAYNVRQKRCDIVDLMPECTTAENSSSSFIGNSLQISNIVSAPELNGFCNTTGDGLFSAGCENYFYSCASGNAYRMKCPEGLYFDSEARVCNCKEHVSLCNSALEDSRIMVNEQDYTYATTAESIDQGDESREIYDIQTKKVVHSHADQIPKASLPALVSVPISKAKPLPILSEDFDCRSKADGFYSIGCKTEFVACANHRMFFFECPQNLTFNEEAQICDYAGNIEYCSEIADINEKESFLTTSPEMEREISPNEETKRVDGAEAIRDQAFCKKLNDGVYFNDCENEYTVCSRQITFAYNCPEGQIIDPISKTCNDPKNIPECVNKNDRI
ncbi:unnamed protein product [Acanthocheilonema viteae]|uniref:Chitin-binding type-2 domain-containing protein n=1 Tax=Acanthocheilonema viteae TaxID=6277 RepID=A0A498S743_ACAVI|nr:unnamed protein product [Acanthocheilonema viteae]